MKINGSSFLALAAPILFTFPWSRPADAPPEDVQLILTQPDYPFPVPDLLVIDIESPRELPFNFRTSKKSLSTKPLTDGTRVPDDGLAYLNISGSGQFCLNQFWHLRETLNLRNVTVVDLRGEPHGHINNMALSWGPPGALRASANPERLEQKWLAHAATTRKATATAFALHGYAQSDRYEPIELKIEVRETRTPRELSTSHGWKYLRLPVPPGTTIPPDSVIDDFVAAFAEREPGSWFHFHCDTGLARTTTFMILADMMANFAHVPADAIIARQSRLGGSNFLSLPKGKAARAAAEDHLTFLRNFHAYCWRAGPSKFRLPWSKWIKSRDADPQDTPTDSPPSP